MSSRFTKSTVAVLVFGGIGMAVVVGGFLFIGAQSQQTESPPQVPDGYSGYKEMNEVRRIMKAEAEQRFVRAKQKVEYGDAEAQFELGNCYRAGVAVAEDQLEAVKWFRKAADQNNIFAQHELGLSYRDGMGVAKDYTEAAKWFSQAADGNLSAAQYRLGDCYANGQGVEKDIVEADAWYLVAQQGGKASAFCRDVLEKIVSPQQIAEAHKRAEKLQEKISAKLNSGGK